MYYLKLFNETLITFDMETKLELIISNINIVDSNAKKYPEMLQQEVTPKSISAFLKKRVVPKNRAFVEKILEAQNLNINDTKSIIDVSKGLSLNDSYWVVDNENLKFEDYNLYDNEFSEVLSLIAFTGYSSKVSGISTSPELTTDGALPKAWRRLNDNDIYLFKGSTSHFHFSNTGYEPYSEYYASQLSKKMGLNAVEYDLCKWKGELVSTCKLFSSKQLSYVPIYYASHTDSINEIYNWLKIRGFENEFADMIMFDALILNPDRHLTNFGVLKDAKTGEYVSFAPIFDCGEGLFAKGDITAFENKRNFKEYTSKGYIENTPFGSVHKDLVSAFCGSQQIERLRKVLTFKFQEHSKYNLPPRRLELINSFINDRAITLIKIIEKSNERRTTINEVKDSENIEIISNSELINEKQNIEDAFDIDICDD